MDTIKPDNLNPRFLNVQYAVRGELAIKAEEYRVKLQKNPQQHGLPFDRVIFSNIGNPQQRGLDQKPLTFVRQASTVVTLSEG
jgi:alanine transaminase